MVSLRKEATLQGLTEREGLGLRRGCYDKKFLTDGGADVEGQYVDKLFLPFYDARQSRRRTRCSPTS